MGPCGSRYSQGDETDFLIRLSSAGHRAWFCNEAVVEHIVRPIQLTESWILQKATHFARSEYILAARHGFRVAGSTGTGLYATHKAWLTDSVRTAFLAGQRTEEAFKLRWEASLARGRAQGARWLARQKVAATLSRDSAGT
jgi:hypothetical protein